MAFPVINGVTSSMTAHATANPCTMPATVNAGDMLLAVLAVAGAPSSPAATGWTAFAFQNFYSNMRAAVLYKIAAGTEGGTSVSFSWASTSAASEVRVARITGVKAQAPEVSYGNTSDPPSLSPSWGAEDALWVAVCARLFNSATISAYPTNYGLAQGYETGSLDSAHGRLGCSAAQCGRRGPCRLYLRWFGQHSRHDHRCPAVALIAASAGRRHLTMTNEHVSR